MADKKLGSRLVETSSIEKIFQIDEHVGAATSGLVADARVLVDYARLVAQINKVTYSERIGVDLLVKRICDYKQNYTQYGGVRPFGTALLVAGVDDLGPSLRDGPSGALVSYKAGASGKAARRSWNSSKRSTRKAWPKTMHGPRPAGAPEGLRRREARRARDRGRSRRGRDKFRGSRRSEGRPVPPACPTAS